MNDALVSELRKLLPVKLQEPMAKHTTFGVGGPADIYIQAKTEEQLRTAYSLARRHRVPVTIFGSGSNMLVGDRGVRGLVIENQYDEVRGPEQNGTGYKVRVGSGMSFSTLARRLARAGYGGLEWACGIPGSLGGAVITNAGAYGKDLADVIAGARVSDADGRIEELRPDQLELGYRDSAFGHGTISDRIVLTVDLRLQPGDANELGKRIREMDRDRRSSQPPGRNCGSVFKNPEGKRAWEYVDAAGLRGRRIGNAQFSELHANFILNLGGATADDVVALIRLAQEETRRREGVELVPEVQFVGEFE